MSDLTDFLLARITEDEEVAHLAAAEDTPPWTADHYAPTIATDAFLRATGERRAWSIFEADDYSATAHVATVAHIARHDPARVLAECAAKRRIVERLSDAYGCQCVPAVLTALALPYADHPDYRGEAGAE